MSEVDEAYAEAQRLIEKARARNAEHLRLSFINLKSIPPEIAALTNLSVLRLDNTKVSDLSPLSALTKLSALYVHVTGVSDLSPLVAMTNLTKLSISFTQVFDLTPIAALSGLAELDVVACPVKALDPITRLQKLYQLDIQATEIADLRPIAALTRLAKEPDEYGFIFKASLATRLDPRLAELAKIQDNAQRVRETFAYLDSLGPDYDAFLKRRMIEEGIDPSDYFPDEASLTDPPDQDDLLRVAQTPDGRLDISPATPAPEELSDTVKRRAHEKLQEAARSLADIAGNRNPRLARTTRTLLDHIDTPFEALDMLDIHFELEALRGTYARRSERTGEDAFDDDTVDALDRVLLIGPGLTLDNAQVTLLETRRDRYRGTPPAAQQDALDALSDAIARDPDGFGDRMRNYSETFRDAQSASSDRLQAGQSILNRNTVIAVTTFVGTSLVSGPLGTAGSNLTLWLASQADPILTLAPTWGAAFEAWITPILMRLREANAGVRGVVRKP